MKSEKKRNAVGVVWFKKLREHLKIHWRLYTMLFPGFLCLFIFSYIPMSGIVLAFKEYKPGLGLFGGPWVWFDNFKYALTGYGFWNLVKNTLYLGFLNLIFGFPSSIILALMINEVGNKAFKRSVQTISYLPYFLSWVIVSSILTTFLSKDYGLVNKMIVAMGGTPVFWYTEPKYWPAILTIVGIWKGIGWGTITFLASMSGISPDLYEAAQVDGAGRWKQTIHITIPGIMPVIGITFILTVANIVKDDYEKIYALTRGEPMLSDTAEVLGTWIFKGTRGHFNQYGNVTAVSLLQSIIGLLLMIGANIIVKKTDNPPLF